MALDEKIDQEISSTIEWSFFAVLFGFLIFFGVIAVIWLLMDILAPVLVGLLLAFIFSPLIHWTHRIWHWPPWITTTLLLLVILGIIASLIIYCVPLVVVQVSQLLDHLPDYIEYVMKLISGHEAKLSDEIRTKISEVSKDPQKTIPLLLQGTVKSLDMLVNTFGMVAYIMIYITLMFVFFVAFALYLPSLREWCKQFIPKTQYGRIHDILHKIYDAAGAFLRTRLVIALILSGIFSIGWAIAGVPYWLLLGVATGFLNIIPYAAMLGWLVTLLINGLEATQNSQSLMYALLWPSVVYAIGQLMDGWVLSPYLEGSKLGIHPVIVIFAVLAGGMLGGILGMLLAIPITAAWQILFSDVIKPYLVRWAKIH